MNAPRFPIRLLHQIELTSRCNLRCRYCPHPNMQRPKVDIDDLNFGRALYWVDRFARLNGQDELNLAGIGESTLHPNFVRYVHLAREVLGPTFKLVLATNGLLMTDELARELTPTKLRVWVSLHRPEKAGPAIEALKRAGILAGVSADPSLSAIDWAGQVKWHRSASPRTCNWVSQGRVVTFADGRVSTCCLDASGAGVVGTVMDDLERLTVAPYSLCGTCDQELELDGYDQRSAA